jgi:ABC-type uncharacterized transport system involved in gliding motility auxiliary subunit
MARFRDRLPEYGFASKQVVIDYVDPDLKPAVAKQYQVQSYGTVVLEYKGRTERVVGDSEQDLTNAIIKVVSGAKKTLYFLQGHGERDPNSSERPGFSTIKSALERENYGVERLALIQAGAVPDQATAVVVAGPTSDLLAPELAALEAYLAKGGKVLLMVDPPATNATPPLPLFEGLAKQWGATLGRDVIVDASGLGQLIGSGFDTPVAVSYPPHPITERFDTLTAFPLARSVTAATGPGGAVRYRVTSLFERVFGLESLAALPRLDDIGEDQAAIRDRLLQVAEARAS